MKALDTFRSRTKEVVHREYDVMSEGRVYQ